MLEKLGSGVGYPYLHFPILQNVTRIFTDLYANNNDYCILFFKSRAK